MIEFNPLTIEMNEKIDSFAEFASGIIKDYYDPIIGADQNDYMIEMFQSSDAIKRQLNDGHTIIMVNDKDNLIGYIAFYEKEEKLYLDKFYLHKDYRGNGYGKEMLEFVKDCALGDGYNAVFLNVNKHNDASIAIYKRMGFTLLRKEKNPIGKGYYMDDYVLELIL